MTAQTTLAELCEVVPERDRPFLDWEECYLDLALSNPNGEPEYRKLLEQQKHWRESGYVVLKNFIPPALSDAYCAAYESANGKGSRMGYGIGTPYMTVKEIRDLCLYAPLVDFLGDIIGEPMGMNLNLTNWISTERTFHQDDYLNPEFVNGHYLAAWVALDDIHPDSGVFEFVPGSHKWPVMRQGKILACLEGHERSNPDWPRIAEKVLDPLWQEEIERRGAEIKSVDMKKGDVLIWHSWLLHRGSKPKNPDLLRKALICHYSGIRHRPDMKTPELYENQSTNSKGHFFPF